MTKSYHTAVIMSMVSQQFPTCHTVLPITNSALLNEYFCKPYLLVLRLSHTSRRRGRPHCAFGRETTRVAVLNGHLQPKVLPIMTLGYMSNGFLAYIIYKKHRGSVQFDNESNRAFQQNCSRSEIRSTIPNKPPLCLRIKGIFHLINY